MGKQAKINSFRMKGKLASNSRSTVATHSTSTGGDPNKLGKAGGKQRGGRIGGTGQ